MSEAEYRTSSLFSHSEALSHIIARAKAMHWRILAFGDPLEGNFNPLPVIKIPSLYYKIPPVKTKRAKFGMRTKICPIDASPV